MSGITRLSDCKTLPEFKDFVAELKSDSKSGGRSFVYIEDGKTLRAYTMNQIVHRFSKSVKESKKALGDPVNEDSWKNQRKQFRSTIAESLEIVNELNTSADQVDGRSILGLRKCLGNAWYAFTHFGFNKEKTLTKIEKKCPDVLISATQQILDEYDGSNFGGTCQRIYTKKGCSISEALECPEAQAIIFENTQLAHRFELLAHIHNVESFTEAHINYASQKLSDSAQKYVDRTDPDDLADILKAKFVKRNLRFDDALLNPNLFNNDLLRPALVAYASRSFNSAILNHHLDFVVQKAMNHMDGMSTGLVYSVESVFKSEGISFRDVVTQFFGHSVGYLFPYNFQYNDSRLHSLFFDIRFKDALLTYAHKLTGFRIDVQYWDLFTNSVVKDADTLVKQANGSLDHLANALIAKFQMQHFSPRDVVFNQTLINDKRLRPALTHYANQNQIEGYSEFLQDTVSAHILTKKGEYQLKYWGKTSSSVVKSLDGKLRREGFSIEDILNRREAGEFNARSTLTGDGFFRPYLVFYAKEHGFDEFLNRHLAFVVEKMVAAPYTLLSYSNSGVIANITAKLQAEGRAIEELFENESLVSDLSNASQQLKLALGDYRNRNTVVKSSEMTQDDFADVKKKEADRLGREDGLARTHLIDTLGLRAAYQADNNGLKKAVLLFIRNHHSDKNADGDPTLIHKATSLLDLINSGNLQSYDQAYRNAMYGWY